MVLGSLDHIDVFSELIWVTRTGADAMDEVVWVSVLLLNFCLVYAQYSVDGKSQLNVDQSIIDGE